VVKLRDIARVLGGKPGTAILLVSTLVAAWIALFGGFVFFGDSVTFFNYATLIIHRRIYSYYYTIGYPLLILLTGFPYMGSLVPLLVLQAAFAALTPWLAFKTFEPFCRGAGFTAGVVCLASLTPFFFENTFFHDGSSLFFGFLSITFASIFFATQQSRCIYLSGASATFAYFVQPGAIGFFAASVCVFSLYGLLDRRQVKHVLASVGICAALIVGFSTYQQWAVHRGGSSLESEQLGRRLFFNEYLQGSPYGELSGPAADQLRRALIEFFGSPSFQKDIAYVKTRLYGSDDYWDLFGQFDGRPRELVDRMFSQPNRTYYETLQIIPDLPNGVPDRLFLRAALAYLYQHPIVVAEFVGRNLKDFAGGAPWQCRGHSVFPDCRISEGTQFYPALPPSSGVVLSPGSMPDRAYRFLTAREVSRGVAVAGRIWQWVYDYLRIPLLASMLFGFFGSFCAGRQLCWTMTTVITAYVANLLVFSLFEEPEFRYQIVGISTCAFATGPGLYLMLLWVCRGASVWLRGIWPLWVREPVSK
jgi:hypothetical protein